MAAYGAFSISTLGMKSQAHAMNVIGENISNMMTGGYKRTETKFSGILSKSLFEQSDIGGVRTKDFQRIEGQGNMVPGSSPFDLAINGKGLFVLNTALSGGKTFYGRDGGFSEALGATKSITQTNADGTTSTFNTNDGYLVDKNGYYVQGWAASTTTPGFGTSLSAMKVDPYAFFGSGISTNSATLALNLPATDPVTPLQVDTVTLAGPVEAGGIYSVTADGTTVSYTATGTEANMNAVRDGLVSAVNADTTLSAKLTAAAGSATGAMTLIAKDIGAPIDITATATNITVVKQSDSVTIGGKFELGDVYTATINGKVYSYTSALTDASNSDAANGLAALINGDTAVSASSGATSNVITITAATAGAPYKLSAVWANGGADTTQSATAAVITANSGAAYVKTKSPYQVETVTLGGTPGEAGDKYSVIIDGTTVNYTVKSTDTSINAIRDGLVSAINADTNAKSAVTAVAGYYPGELTLTSKTLNSSVVVTASATNTSAVAQSDSVTIGGLSEAGDIYTATIGSNTYSFTSLGGGNNADATGLAALINADSSVSATATGSVITITAATAGTPYTLSAVGASGGIDNTQSATAAVVTANSGVADNTATEASLLTGPTVNYNTSSINVYDSNGNSQPVILNFVKTDTNKWQMSTTNSQTAVAQVDTVTLAGTIEAGDKYSATINGTTVSYTVTGADLNINAVRDGLVSAINANKFISNELTAAAGSATGALTLTAKKAGSVFNATSSATNIPPVAQSDSITVSGLSEAGDIYTATIGSNIYSFPSLGGGNNADATGLAALINADSSVSATTTGSVITITATAAGTPYILSAVGASGGIDNTQSATAAVGTANSGIADNTATLVSTTANVSSTVTSAPYDLTFDGNGQLTSTSPIALNLTFAGGSTATVSLDISNFNQYAGDFSIASYTKNGRSGGIVTNYNFDSAGQVVANFADGSARAVYKIPIAIFANVDALEKYNGNTFAETTDSGKASVLAADTSGFAAFVPGTLELSNVDMADEFSKMIMTQHAYTASSKVFQTIDEMLMTARDL